MRIRNAALTGLTSVTVIGLLAAVASGDRITPAVATQAGQSGSSAASVVANVNQATSANWAGYVASGNNFSSVSGTWTVPAASSSSAQGYSATWVGLGGSSDQSQSLEQAGTESDFVNGQAQYRAWYELLPAAQQKLNLEVQPGDRVSTTVTVNGTTVDVSMSDQATGQSVTASGQMSNPDTSSADWIVESPAAEQDGGSYQILPLANFGKVTFTSATATTGGHTGGIGDSNWQATQIQLNSDGASTGPDGVNRGFFDPSSLRQQSSSGATTSTLAGGQFTVTWQGSSSDGQSASGGSPPSGNGGSAPEGYGGYGPGGYGNAGGYGDGYGAGGYGDPGGYGYGSGGYGYGSGGYGSGGGGGGGGGYGSGGYGSGGYGYGGSGFGLSGT